MKRYIGCCRKSRRLTAQNVQQLLVMSVRILSKKQSNTALSGAEYGETTPTLAAQTQITFFYVYGRVTGNSTTGETRDLAGTMPFHCSLQAQFGYRKVESLVLHRQQARGVHGALEARQDWYAGAENKRVVHPMLKISGKTKPISRVLQQRGEKKARG